MPTDITRTLQALSRGDREGLDELMPLVHDELRRLARSRLRRERPDHTLQPTALVNEAYLRLVDQAAIDWHGRAHFFSIAARLMRQILVDHAREREAAKRGGGATRVSLDEAVVMAEEREVDLLALDAALASLARMDPQQSRLVEMRFFGGLTIAETADVLGISESTVKREWSLAKAWLKREIAPPT